MCCFVQLFVNNYVEQGKCSDPGQPVQLLPISLKYCITRYRLLTSGFVYRQILNPMFYLLLKCLFCCNPGGFDEGATFAPVWKKDLAPAGVKMVINNFVIYNFVCHDVLRGTLRDLLI